jgi:hypothetical protein
LKISQVSIKKASAQLNLVQLSEKKEKKLFGNYIQSSKMSSLKKSLENVYSNIGKK